MKNLLLLFFLGIYSLSYSQTWSDDVAQIFYDKCTKCHHTGGVAQFSLMSHAEASPMATAIYDAVLQNEMPPWPPDNNYQSYVHDRALSATEKTTILDWINAGVPEGNPANTPPAPTYQQGSILGSGDLEIQIPTYMSKATAQNDDYVCFALPSNLPADRYVKSIEVVPGNPAIVHHALIYVDPTGNSVTDTIGGDCAGPTSNGAALVAGYTPGSTPMTLPSVDPLKLGVSFPANSQVVFEMHYPEGSYGLYDSTKVIFHFYPPGETGIREILSAPIIQNWNFVLPPEQLTPVSGQYPSSGGIPSDYSILSVFPHMHLLGQSMKVYGLDPQQDTTRLINIPHWDFEWQDFYYFKNIVKAVSGSVFHADGIFNNTSGNLHNPNQPPITVYPGLNTSDEMFLVYMQFMEYEAGDENYDIDSLMNLSTLSILDAPENTSVFDIYPNPFSSSIHFTTNQIKEGDQVSVYIYDSQGQLIRRLLENVILEDEYLDIEWNGTDENGEIASSGLYFISVNHNGKMEHQRVVKK